MKLKNLQILLSMGISILFIYFYDYFLTESLVSQQFWCIEVYKEFNIQNINNIRLPIHCDEGPYRLASESLENFFDKNNPYQGRPLFVFLIFLIRNAVDFFSMNSFDEYTTFRISMFVLQSIILFFILKTFISIVKINFETKLDYVILFLIIGIPSIRWNLFLSAVGNLTFLIFLISIHYTINVDRKNKSNKYYLLLGVLSLAHQSAIIYGLIIKLFEFLKYKKINFKNSSINLGWLVAFQLIYRFIVNVSKYDFYDWHKEEHNQFYWILSAINNSENLEYCQTFQTFIKCNNFVTRNYIGYFFIIMLYFFLLLILSRKQEHQLSSIIVNSFFINIFIFIFWSAQGTYEAFRFINYSIGYFLFFSTCIFCILFNKNKFLILSLIFYQYSILYLEPYNIELNSPQINFMTWISLLFFVIFILNHFLNYKNIRSSKK